MRIGLIAAPWIPVPPVGYGGAESVIDTLARGLRTAGHDVLLATTGDATCEVDRHAYFATAAEPMGSTLPEIVHVLSAYDALSDCDVIHDHTLVGPVLAAQGGAPCPVVTTNHGAFTPEMRMLYASLAPAVPVIAISHSQRALAPEVPIARVIHHGLRPEDFPVGTGDGDYVAFLGRMAPEKGVHLAVEAARSAGVRLVIAAKMREPAERAYFAAEVEPLLCGDVEFVGEISTEERLALLGGARALVNPICWSEPFGMVMIEAMACGTPVVAFPAGAAPEIVDDGVTGMLCADFDALVEGIRECKTLDRGSCRHAVETRFSAQRMVREHVDLYKGLV